MLKCTVQVMRWQDTRVHRPAICTRNRCTHYVQSDGLKVANALNKFYVNFGPVLASKIPSTAKDPCDYINYRCEDIMRFEPVDCYEIRNVIMQLKNSSPGYDDMLASVIKKIK